MIKNKMKSSLFKMMLIAAFLSVTSCSKAPERKNPVGREFRSFFDTERVSWLGEGSRPLATTIWYPASLNSVESEWNIGVFQAGWNALNADIVSSPKTLPLIILSHGTGGAALQLSWLAEILASNGYLVVAVNHHGNTAAEDAYLPQGFMLWWERAQDISSVIDQLLSDAKFGPRIDSTRIGAAGFSLGGYTVMSIAGARTELAQWKAFCKDKKTNPICTLPPEAGFSIAELESLIKNDSKVKSSVARSNGFYRDKRVQAVYSIAPVQGPAFTKSSLAHISIPVRIIVGTRDDQAIPEFNAELIASAIPNSELELLPNVAHYTFLARCSLKGKLFVSELCSDPEGIDREKIHNKVGADVLEFFAKTLIIKSDVNK